MKIVKWIILVIIALLIAGAFIHLVAAPAGEPKERAVSAIEQALKTDPNNAELWAHLGFAYRKLGNMPQAQSAFEKAVRINPQNKESLYMLGLIYESQRATDAAKKTWQAYLAVETDPEKRSVAEKHLHFLSQ